MNLQSVSIILANWIFLGLIAGILIVGVWRKLPVFDVFIQGAREGFETTIKIIPYLVAMLIAIGMLRASGAFDLLAKLLAPVLNSIGMPADLLPLALIRPFSGSASNGVMAEIIHNHGGDALVSKMAATMMGSTETTFYVIAVYFGAVSIRRSRHAIPVGLLADLTGIIAAVLICRLVFV